MREHPFRAVIFDLDGTLFNTLADIAFSINSVLDSRGYPTHEAEEYRTMVGSGIRTAVQRALPRQNVPEGEIDEMAAEVNRIYSRNPAGRTVFYDGIEKLLDDLSDRGIAMSVLSNKPDPLVQLISDSLLGRWRFVRVLGHEGDMPRKPDPQVALQMTRDMRVEPGEVMFLGDSDVDMITALNSGMLAAGAGWGFRGKDELLRSGAAVVFDHPLEIQSYFN